MKPPTISVIIATRNEERNIKNVLQSIKQQEYPLNKVEIVVIDNNSNDHTQVVARKYTKNVINIASRLNLHKIINPRGAQINYGVKKSKGTIIFFPDADMTFDPKLFQEIAHLIEVKRMEALYIPEIVIGKGFLGKIRNFERSFYNTTCIDGVRATTKNLFQKIGGFDEQNILFGPDDWDFTKRLKAATKRISITTRPLYHHEENLGLGAYLLKKTKYSNTFDGYIQKWGRADADIKRQLGLHYRFLGVFIEKGKWKKLILHPVLTSCMYALRMLVGLSYAYQKYTKSSRHQHVA